jgi:hypothetical protein
MENMVFSTKQNDRDMKRDKAIPVTERGGP